jgi:BirA family biotin operon repressor/biotin-[acetyl-CoA-carboxylase] ligase
LRPKLRNLLAINTVKAYPNWLHYLPTVDSTNIYATRLAEDGLAHHGEVVWALDQTQGRGQRGKQWDTRPGENVMMSLIVQPTGALTRSPAHLNMMVAATIARYFEAIGKNWAVHIKWPNDIYVNDKKAVGILIENVFRGMQWTNAVIGIGINVNQTNFNPELTRATSLKAESGKEYDLFEIINDLRSGLLNELIYYKPELFKHTLQQYNQFLYKRGEEVRFTHMPDGAVFTARVIAVSGDGTLILEQEDGMHTYPFGSLQWHL